MATFTYITVLLIFFVSLFIRDCQLDHKRRLENERKGNLHVLKVSLNFFKEHNITPEHDFEKEIGILENQNFEVTVWDYLPFKKC